MKIDESNRDFLIKYNELISSARYEKNNFSFLASPTLNKQETISFLYKNILSNKIKYRVLKLILMFLLFIPRIIYHLYNLLVINLRFKISSLPLNHTYVRTWLVPKVFNNNKIEDDYFRNLIHDLKKDNKVVIGFSPLNYGKELKKFQKNKNKNFIIPIGLLELTDIFKIMYRYVFTGKANLDNEYFFNNKPVSKIINFSLSTDYFKFRSFQAYLDFEIAKKIKKYEPKSLIYIFENQAWEKSYLKVFKNSDTLKIGYQSSGFSFRFLNFFPSKTDFKKGLFPDKILTVGDHYTKILKKFGNFPVPVITFAALRFNYPVSKKKYIIEQPIKNIHQRILYAFAVHTYQYPIIINNLIKILGNTNVQVILKFHPLFDPKNNKINLPNNFKIWNANSYCTLKNSFDFVLFNDNSFGIESLLLGVRAYEFKFGEIYPENRMLDFNLYKSSLNIHELKSAVAKLLTGKFDKSMDKNYISTYININYKPYNKNSLYLLKT